LRRSGVLLLGFEDRLREARASAESVAVSDMGLGQVEMNGHWML
jgi:hypothetical protein